MNQESSSIRVPPIAAFLAIVAAFLPLLILHFAYLWRLTHYQYFPFILIAVIYLLWDRLRTTADPESVSARKGRTDRRFFLILSAGLVLLVIAVYLFSPWLAAVAFIITLGAFAVKLRQARPIVNLTGIWLLLWLLVPLPFRYDLDLIQWLQRVSTNVSSGILDLLGKLHHTEGNVLSFPGKDFFVDEACSGIMSLMAMVAAAAIIAVWRNRTLLHALLLIAGGFFWAGFMNVIRIALIAFVHFRFQVDLSSGWQHEVTGFVLFALGFLAVLGTDALLQFLLRRIPVPDDAEGNPLVRAWNRLAGFADPLRRASEPVEHFPENPVATTPAMKPPANRSGPAPRWLRAYAVIFLVFGIFQIGIIRQLRKAAHVENTPGFADTRNLVSRDSLTPRNPDWVLVDFQSVERSHHDIFGENSLMWRFKHPEYVVTMTLDYPFDGWHELPKCYVSRGWEKTERNVLPADDWVMVETTLNRPTTGENGYLLFCEFTPSGIPATPPEKSPVKALWYRLAERGALRRIQDEFLYQTQIWVVDGHFLTDAQRREIREEFRHLRTQLKDKLRRPLAGSPGSIVNHSRGS